MVRRSCSVWSVIADPTVAWLLAGARAFKHVQRRKLQHGPLSRPTSPRASLKVTRSFRMGLDKQSELYGGTSNFRVSTTSFC
jgi:hypothetical protein